MFSRAWSDLHVVRARWHESVTPVDVEIVGATGTVKAIINHLGRIIAMMAPRSQAQCSISLYIRNYCWFDG